MQLDLPGTAILAGIWLWLGIDTNVSYEDAAALVTVAAVILFHVERQYRSLQLQRRINRLCPAPAKQSPNASRNQCCQDRIQAAW